MSIPSGDPLAVAPEISRFARDKFQEAEEFIAPR
jgi:hypothetical protein